MNRPNILIRLQRIAFNLKPDQDLGQRLIPQPFQGGTAYATFLGLGTAWMKLVGVF